MFWTYEHEAILYTGLRLHRKLFHCGNWKTGGTLNASRSKGISLFSTRKSALHSAGPLFVSDNFWYAEWGKGRLLGLYASWSRTNSSSTMKQSIRWAFLNDAMAISEKDIPKNQTAKERFAAALSCIQTRILTLLSRANGGVLVPVRLSVTAF